MEVNIMNKKITIIPIMTAFMALCSLSFVPNKVTKVNATGEEYLERYFLFDENCEYSIKPNVNKQGVTGWVSFEETSLPLYVDVVSENVFHISMILDGTKYYAKVGDSTSYLDSNIANASTWTINPLGNGTFNINANGGAYRLGFKNKIVAGTPIRCFGTTSEDNPDFNYTLVLLPFEDRVEDFVTAIDNIDCVNHIDFQTSWENAQSEYNNLPQPVKNYLKTLGSNKDALHSTIEYALSKYDYIAGKYEGKEGYDYISDYMERDPDDPSEGNVFYNITNNESNNQLTFIVTAVALITIASVTSLLFFKRKRK